MQLSGTLKISLAALLGLAVAMLWVSGPLVHWLGGDFSHDPEDAEWLMSAGASALIEDALGEFKPGELRDYHMHLLGHADPARGRLHPDLLSWWHPVSRMRGAIFLSASGVSDMDQANEQYLARLVRLVRTTPGYGRHYLLPLDQNHDEAGNPKPDASDVYVSNSYAFDVAERYPELFMPAASIHPYRSDAIEALKKWAENGVRIIKWLPNAQGIDPADARLLPFYEAMVEHDMTLLSHAGEENAVRVDSQDLGNPLRLRLALDTGVKVIVAHAASLGEGADLDNPDQPPASNLSLFLRLMDERQYANLLYGEISGTTQVNRLEALEGLLQRPDLHSRLVNGSDYPLPAVNVTVHLDAMNEAGLLDAGLVPALREIYDFNPLIFDLVLKRSLRLPGTELGFARDVFVAKPGLGAD